MSENPARAITEDGFEEFFKDLVRTYSPDAKFVHAKDLKCIGCHGCCKGANVSLALSDIFRMSEHLKMTPRDFIVKYAGFTVVKDKDTDDDLYFFGLNATGPDGCPFLTDAGCSIYAVRPMVCRAFPTNVPKFIRYDILQDRNKKRPECGVHKADPNTYIIPDIGLLVDIYTGSKAMYDYIKEIGNQNWSPRHADGFVHRELANRRRKAERDLIARHIAEDLVEYMKELN
jgi:Fe-S-cluster containining protein